mmetsp:Transcript_35445/g.40390  ORF Transcript_35445/g.40390 Transcript_35445/m.40390 type:complete len:121 (-) Transcript_35445:70-432(-)
MIEIMEGNIQKALGAPFFAVGLAHWRGDMSIENVLNEKGYTMKRITNNYDPSSYAVSDSTCDSNSKTIAPTGSSNNNNIDKVENSNEEMRTSSSFILANPTPNSILYSMIVVLSYYWSLI